MKRPFEQSFHQLTGYRPLGWQSRLFQEHFQRGELPQAIDVPTGLGKTAVMALWLIARAQGAPIPRRLIYVVDRRAVVDQATDFAVSLRERLDRPEAAELKSALGLADRSLPISTLRGQHADNREWLIDPSLPAIIVGTVDMIGSRLLFQGYGVSRRMRPYQAGLLGADVLALIDESHLVPPFEALLASIANDGDRYGGRDTAVRDLLPRFRVLPLSATSRASGANVFRLDERDYMNANGSVACEVTYRRLTACKSLTSVDAEAGNLVATLVEQAWRRAFPNADTRGGPNLARASRIVVFCDRRDDAERVKAALDKRARSGSNHKAVAADTELLVGARRVRERQSAAKRLEELGFIPGSQVQLARPAFLVATSAGEVGVDLDADHMVCDLVTWERMVQRLGRVNRRGDGVADVVVVQVPPPDPMKPVAAAIAKPEAHRTKKDKQAIAQYQAAVAAHRALALPLRHLPESGGKLDVSPLALMNLAKRATGEEAVRQALRQAASPLLLRPGLTRALVDAWAMTSLPEHTARPEVQPWLRGWADQRPQTAIVWRKYLPVRPAGQPAATRAEIEAFFEAAPPHISEVLETETFRVVEWLKQRAGRLLRGRDASATVDNGAGAPGERVVSGEGEEISNEALSAQSLALGVPVGFVLSYTGSCERVLTLQELVGDEKKWRETLEAAVAARTLILDTCFGGLSPDGMLDETAAGPAEAADDEAVKWIAAAAGRPAVSFRVQPGRHPANDAQLDEEWHPVHIFVVEWNAEREPIRWFVVENWRDAATTEDARATGPAQTLQEHQSWAERRARELAKRLALPEEWANALALAARLHDEGKRAPRWQEAFNAPRTGGPYAKTRGPIRQRRLEGYRHEFGSLPYAEADSELKQLPDDRRDLVLHLIAAHHGYARPLIPVEGCDDAPPSQLQERARGVALRFARLQRRWGPWGLAWWEALLRAADQQASRENEERAQKPHRGT